MRSWVRRAIAREPTSPSSSSRESILTAAGLTAGVFLGTFVLRWLTLDFDNDYFMHMAWAAEMLRGELAGARLR